MRRFFQAFGILAAVMVVVAIGGFATLVYVGSGLDRESRAYADSAVQAITAHWDVQALLDRAAPDLVGSTTREQMRSLFDWFGVLGPLTDSRECQGSSNIYAPIGGKVTTSARYVCPARYQAGEATIELGLIKMDGAWKVNGFHVNSSVLMAHPPLQKS